MPQHRTQTRRDPAPWLPHPRRPPRSCQTRRRIRRSNRSIPARSHRSGKGRSSDDSGAGAPHLGSVEPGFRAQGDTHSRIPSQGAGETNVVVGGATADAEVVEPSTVRGRPESLQGSVGHKCVKRSRSTGGCQESDGRRCSNIGHVRFADSVMRGQRRPRAVPLMGAALWGSRARSAVPRPGVAGSQVPDGSTWRPRRISSTKRESRPGSSMSPALLPAGHQPRCVGLEARGQA